MVGADGSADAGTGSGRVTLCRGFRRAMPGATVSQGSRAAGMRVAGRGGVVMDPVVAAFGTALVGAIATDTWQQAHEAVVGLWRRVHPRRDEDIGAELDE